jgi:hypothetical protein
LALLLNASQRRRIEKIYAEDFALIENLRKQRAQAAEGLARAVRIAAE